MLDRDQARRALGTLRVGVGAAALLAPAPTASMFGLSSAPDVRVLARLFALRELYLGARDLDSQVSDGELRLQAAVDSLDAVVALAATVAGHTPRRTAVLVGAAAAIGLGLGRLAQQPKPPELSVVR